MLTSSFLAAGLVINIIAVLFLLSAIVLVLVILIQKGKGGGLSGAFAGGMASGILGSKTGDVLTWITIGLVSFFLVGAIALNKWWKPTISSSQTQTQSTTPISGADTGMPASQPEPPPAAPVSDMPAEN